MMPKIVTDEAVFEAVIQTVAKYGYVATTIKQIADAADTSEATLFRKYGSKEQLFVRAIEYGMEQMEVDSFVYYTGDIYVDLVRILRRLFSKERADMPLLITIAAELIRIPEINKMIDSSDRFLFAAGRLLARYQAEGVMEPEHPLQAVATFLGPIILMQMVERAAADIVIPTPDLDEYVRKFLNGRLIGQS